ncbi:MAG: tetratricopeptide repeat protein [Pirellulales bacterium]
MSTVNHPDDRFPVQLHCPNCNSAIEPNAHEGEVHCASCGSSFHLDPDRTQIWSPDQLPKLGKFELLETIGRGAFGMVYRARDTQLDRIVAIKVPRSGQLATAEDEDRFVREARNAAQLQHPGIVPVYEVGRSDSLSYIVSEYVKGVTLADALSGRKFNFRESAQLIAQAAAALAHAHAQGVVHRDLKPSNVMLTSDGSPRVMDFGLSKRDTGDVTVTIEGQVLGTPAYMSPEQACGQAHHVDGRGDIYGLGAILYELLTGELPFRGNQRMILHQVMNDEPRGPRSLNDRIPRDLETICLTAMAKEPSRRYQTAQAMADDLTRWLEGQPIQARPVGHLERAWRWCRRNRAVASMAAAVILALMAGTGISTMFAIEARARAREALSEKGRANAKATEAEKERQKAIASQQLEARQRRRAEQAEIRATDDARRANLEAEKAQQVARFLARLFEESAPFEMAGLRFGVTEKAMAGANLTAREILDRGAQRISTELKDQPIVQAALQEAIGNVYLGVGMTDKADALLQEAMELRREHLPREHLDIASGLHSIGVLRFIQGRPEECAQALEESLAIRRKLLGEDHELVDTSRMAVGALLGFIAPRGPSDELEAIRLCRDTLAWRRKHYGNSHHKTAIAMCALAGALLPTNQQDESARLILEATPILLNDPLTKSLGLAMTQLVQAELMKRVGQRELVIAATRRALEAARETADDGHPLLLFVRIWSVNNFLFGAEYNEAEAICREWLARTKLTGRNPSFIDTYLSAQLARVLLRKSARTADSKDLEEAEALYRECLAGVHKEKAYTMRLTLQFIMELAGDLGARKHALGQYAEAEQAFRECVRLGQQTGGAKGDPLTRRINAGRLGLADALASQGKAQEAEATYRALIAEGDDIQVASSYGGLARMFCARGEVAMAVAVSKDRFESLRQKLLLERAAARGGKIDVTPLAQAVMTLRDTLRARGEDERAEALVREYLPITREHVDTSFTMKSFFWLAVLKQGQAKFDEAQACYRECLQLAEQYRTADSPLGGYWVNEVHLFLGICLGLDGKTDEAEAMLRQVVQAGNVDQANLANEALILLFHRLQARDKTIATASGRLEETRAIIAERLKTAAGGKVDVNLFANALFRAAIVLQGYGKSEQSLVLMRDAMPLLHAHTDLVYAVWITAECAAIERSLGRADVALRLLDEAMKWHAALDPKTPWAAENLTSRLMYERGCLLVDLRKTTEAEEAFRAVAARRQTEYTSASEMKLAELLDQREADEEAEARLRDALIADRDSGAYELWAQRWRILCRLAQQQGADPDATTELLAAAEPVLAEAREKLGAGNFAVGTILISMGELLADSGQFARAEPLVKEAVEIYRRQARANDWRQGHAQNALGRCLLGLARYEQAEAALQSAYSNLVMNLGPHHELSRQAAGNLVHLYEAWQNTEKAQEYRKLPHDAE